MIILISAEYEDNASDPASGWIIMKAGAYVIDRIRIPRIAGDTKEETVEYLAANWLGDRIAGRVRCHS